jgi:plastocyanin
MKNTYIAIIVLVVLVLGFWFFGLNSKQAQAPEVVNTEGTNTNTTTLDTNIEPPVTATNPAKPQPIKEFTVTGKNFSFSPSLITVQKGDRVKITFKNTQGFHDFLVAEYGVGTKQAEAPFQEVVEFTADKAGSFEYYCSVGSHRAMGMKGTLVVQ